MIRPARETDIPAVLEMARALHAESPRYSRLTLCLNKVEAQMRASLKSTLTTDATGGGFVAERDGEIIGVIGGFITEHFFSYDKLASDYTFYVKPEHRGGFTAARLIRAFEQWAIAQGAVDIIPGTSTMIDAESTRELYMRLGYEHYGYSMIKRVR